MRNVLLDSVGFYRLPGGFGFVRDFPFLALERNSHPMTGHPRPCRPLRATGGDVADNA